MKTGLETFSLNGQVFCVIAMLELLGIFDPKVVDIVVKVDVQPCNDGIGKSFGMDIKCFRYVGNGQILP